ncbi:hypothetical protein C8J57DRAFT_1239770 [Mycena rebaudengoi]|nr:hypothetical protein C8J57DRAFT_1239770 [Mycena rebaudengoi]
MSAASRPLRRLPLPLSASGPGYYDRSVNVNGPRYARSGPARRSRRAHMCDQQRPAHCDERDMRDLEREAREREMRDSGDARSRAEAPGLRERDARASPGYREGFHRPRGRDLNEKECGSSDGGRRHQNKWATRGRKTGLRVARHILYY